jgi:hypothetical protein
MIGYKVQCPNCKRADFITTAAYLPGVTPHGGFVKSLLPYHLDWLTSSTTTAAMMTCPECCAQLAPSGRLTVINPEPVQEAAAIEDEVEAEIIRKHVCDICGKEVSTALALNGHKRSHRKEEPDNDGR